MLRLVPAELVHGETGGLFVWPAGLERERWRDYRLSTSEQRSFAHIALEEIANAMLDVTMSTRIGSDDELARAAMEALGYHRLTDGIRGRLEIAADLALRTSRVVRDGAGSRPGI